MEKKKLFDSDAYLKFLQQDYKQFERLRENLLQAQRLGAPILKLQIKQFYKFQNEIAAAINKFSADIAELSQRSPYNQSVQHNVRHVATVQALFESQRIDDETLASWVAKGIDLPEPCASRKSISMEASSVKENKPQISASPVLHQDSHQSQSHAAPPQSSPQPPVSQSSAQAVTDSVARQSDHTPTILCPVPSSELQSNCPKVYDLPIKLPEVKCLKRP
jgi:hypothetical protein